MNECCMMGLLESLGLGENTPQNVFLFWARNLQQSKYFLLGQKGLPCSGTKFAHRGNDDATRISSAYRGLSR